jgi:hypothetical protein
MKAAFWLCVSPFVVLALAAGFAACGDDPLYACPDPSMPCIPDAGSDAADANAGD